MRAHQVKNNIIVNTIIVDSLDIFPNLIDASIGGGIGDTIINGVVQKNEITLNIPMVSPFQLRVALTQLNLRQAVEVMVSQQSQEIKDGWEYATAFERHHPLILTMISALGLTDKQADDVFLLATTFNG